MNFQITLNRFNAAGIRTSLCPENKKDVTFKGIIPSIINEGKWIVLNVPLREYDDGAILLILSIIFCSLIIFSFSFFESKKFIVLSKGFVSFVEGKKTRKCFN